MNKCYKKIYLTLDQVSDHGSIFADFHTQILFGDPPTPILPPLLQSFKLDNPERVCKFLDDVYHQLNTNHIFQTN